MKISILSPLTCDGFQRLTSSSKKISLLMTTTFMQITHKTVPWIAVGEKMQILLFLLLVFL